ncbi:prohibitin family protein [Bacillus atrophaeus]|uniref:prohibitin family protein n=1 Tax=Bacillus atrophaeus TaxID=1452 RepID=UPI00227E3609|nr:prohibitin family protein [Bacillus atrophaeus]MCY7948051.1 prohibitin family protein [Bacillus atrophaeus]MCY8098004.1 prohibitin family protein [Bacillus atrophaeus]MCY9169928.1 prohibitin family protein [Bacillus atrophaeus]MEC0740653.1 prohibitin family protein [Bacillus atrophaeus]MEC0747083.1 prohibitin family protein [Bacillus atrophaeus]
MTVSVKTKVGAVVVGAVIVTGAILGAMSIEPISQGHAGVVYNRSHGVEEKALGQGWHLVSPFERVTEYPVSTETVKVDKFNVQTKDGKPLTVELSYDYSNSLEKLPYIYNKFKGQDSETIQSGWLQTRIKKATLNVFSRYSVLEVFQHQGNINAEIEKEFRKTVEEHGFIIDSVTLGAPTPDKKTSQAIQAVVDAQQKLEQLEIEKKQTKVQAEKDIEKAKGESEAKRITAEGEAKANEILRKSLSDEIVNYKAIEQWDGKLPQVTGDSTPMITIPKNK